MFLYLPDCSKNTLAYLTSQKMFLTPLGQSYKKIRSHLLSRFCKLASFRICKIEIFANRRQHFFGFNIYFTIALYIEHLLWYRDIAVILFNKYNYFLVMKFVIILLFHAVFLYQYLFYFLYLLHMYIWKGRLNKKFDKKISFIDFVP